MNERILAHFERQARYCAEYGSPFTAELIRRMGADAAAGGPVAALVGDYTGDPMGDVLALRLAAALHAAVLMKRDAALATLYPDQRKAWRMDEVWPVAKALLARDADWARDFIRLPPQTNEARRSILFAAAFLHFAETWSGPIDTLELGASAGLNVNWDRFRYTTAEWSWGDADSPVRIDTDWRGPAPPRSSPFVRDRAACDLHPLDIRDPQQLLRLTSYIWPDQPERLARFAGAAAMAKHVHVERAEAAAWLKRKLAVRAKDAATVVYHSLFLQYPSQEDRAAIIAAMDAAGAAATPDAPLAWIRFESEALLDGVLNSPRFMLDLTTWPGRTRRVLGYSDGHVRAVEAV